MDSEPQETTTEAHGNGVLDRTIALLKKFNLYLLTLATVVGSWYALHDVAKVESQYIYLLVSVPFLLLFLCEILPNWYKKHQIDKLIELGITDTVTQADYFRLQPYEAADYGRFQRADQAHEKVLQWLLKTPSPWLYLTGLSGSGKSSLLQAFVIPELQKQGYRVLVIRSFANPLQALEQELQRPDVIWKNPPKTEMPLAQRLQEACAYLKKEKLLLVFDQFEEFVILQNESAYQALQDFLTELDSALPANLRFLAVVRTDYMGKLSELALPERYEFRQSCWFDLRPFTLANARQFLQDSGLNLNPALCEKVLAEAVELEESRGLIRPITLNILGVVLTWFSGGGSLKNVQAGQLIKAYLQEALNEPTGFAPLLVALLLSNAGTKLPRSEADLQNLSALNKGAVRGCLIHLSGKGLVRELDKGVWEVFHDFIARLLSNLVWRMRLKWWKRVLPYLSYSALALWLVAVAVGYPKYGEWQSNRARNILAEQGITIANRTIEIGKTEKEIDIDKSSFLTATIVYKNEEWFQKYFSYFADIKQLQALRIYCKDKQAPLPSFDYLPQLQSLEIGGNCTFTLSSLEPLTQLTFLTITTSEGLELPSLEHLTQLQSLEIIQNYKLKKPPLLDKLTKLETLQLGMTELELLDIKSLQSLPQLKNIIVGNYINREKDGDINPFRIRLNKLRAEANLPPVKVTDAWFSL